MGSPTAGNQLPIRQQYAYNLSSSPPQMAQQARFVDSNPRPTKSPRHVAPTELPTNPPYQEYNARFAPPYGGSADQLEPRGAGHFPSAMGLQSWTGAPDSTGLYGPPMPTQSANLQQDHYQFPSEQYPKTDGGSAPPNYSWSNS